MTLTAAQGKAFVQLIAAVRAAVDRAARRRDPIAAPRQTGDDLGLFDLEVTP